MNCSDRNRYERERRAKKKLGQPTKWEVNREARRLAITSDCGKASNTQYGYGCRCDACRYAHSEYSRLNREREYINAENRIRLLIDKVI